MITTIQLSLLLLLGYIHKINGYILTTKNFVFNNVIPSVIGEWPSLPSIVIPANRISPPIVEIIRGAGYVQYADLTFSYHPDELSGDRDTGARMNMDDNNMNNSTNDLLYVDIVVAGLKEKKKKNSDTLDNWEMSDVTDKNKWMLDNMGIGVQSDLDFYLCCTDDALSSGACEADEYGRLIISQPHKIKHHNTVTLPRSKKFDSIDDKGVIDNWMVEHPNVSMGGIASFEYIARLALIIANCNMTETTESGAPRTLSITGEMVWLSYIASQSVKFALLWTIIHVSLLVWYRYQMILNKTNCIQVETWIYYVLYLASLDAFFNLFYQALEVFFSKSQQIHEFLFLRFLSDIITTTAHVMSRCLYIVIALGWGVIKTKLSSVTKVFLVIFGGAAWIFELLANLTGDLSFLKQDEDLYSKQYQFHDLLNLISFSFNIFFIIWIPCALCQTMSSIKRLPEDMGVERKLQRYKMMYGIYFLSLGCTLLMVFLFVADMVIFIAGNHVIYIVVLVCMAILWKPNPMAPVYGYVLLEDDEFGNDDNNISPIAIEMAETDKSSSIMKQS